MPGKLSDLLWGPLFARGYNRFSKVAEDAGLRDKRRALLARARGRTLEIGAGTGVNLELYPDSVTELVLTEPDSHMRRQLQKKLAAAGRPAEVVDAGGEHLPLPDASVDTAVATLVFCTIPDPEAVLGEIARVLKPEGRLLFLEHVRAEDPKTARMQDRFERPWSWFGRGCHPNRDTLATLEASAFEVADVEHDQMPKAPPIVRPLILGEARLPGQA
jgi:ubiquinone/menaquinone biosynthesis C-methylase UbiE